MSKIAWHPLMEAGLKVLRLEPKTFWDLTPAELLFLCADINAAQAGLGRAGLNELIAQFPDETSEEGKLNNGRD